MINSVDKETNELNLKFEKSKKLIKNIRKKSTDLQKNIKEWNEDVEIYWYRNHDVLYLDPHDDKFKIIQAWPSFSDSGEIIWTKCDDEDTILSEQRVLFYLLSR